MKSVYFASLFIISCCGCFAQRLDYTIMQTGQIKLEEESDRNLDGLSVVYWVATESNAGYIEATKRLSEELAKKPSNKAIIDSLRKNVEFYEETAKIHRVGKEELVGCTVEYIVDSQNKLTIVGKTKNGNKLFEFGKGHNQELVLYGVDENDNEDFFDIAVYDHGGGGLIGIVRRTLLESQIFIGSIKRDEYIEFIDLHVIPSGQLNDGTYTALLDANQVTSKRIRQKMISIFPKDSDGDRWMLCK